MLENAREEILGRLKMGPAGDTPDRLDLPPLPYVSMDKTQLAESFIEKLTARAGVVHCTANQEETLEKLAEILHGESVVKAMAGADDILAPYELPKWGLENGIDVMTPLAFEGRRAFKDAVFDLAEAGITGGDFAVAESGTLAFLHCRRQARLLSLAPILHVAIVPSACLVPTYETVIEAALRRGGLPSQISLVTGPSMTGDIQATATMGMHGPRQLVVILEG